MAITAMTSNSSGDPIAEMADAHLRQHLQTIWRRTDRLLAGLLMSEWIAGIALALGRSPLIWDGPHSRVHPHVWAAFLLGGAILSFPIFLVLKYPGQKITRHVVAAAQMLMSALLIHIGDGRVEMHFHIFGSLAFIAFYRDWRVLITATSVVVMDHLLRGIFMPMSIYGVLSASLWRTAEHAGWVLFEDIFLIGACVQGVEEMTGIARNHALIEHSRNDVEWQVTQRTDELKSTQAELMKTARFAGMAEIATSVLHNVGNVLNSVNVSATIVADKLKQSEVPSLAKVSQMMTAHKPDLAGYITTDARGKMIPDFLAELADCLGAEQQQMLGEIENLSKGIEHIKQVVASQQSMAKSSNINSAVEPTAIAESAIGISGPPAAMNIQVKREYQPIAQVTVDQHKVLQILINLLSNAKQAVTDRPADQRRITMRVKSVDSPTGARLQYQVVDTGAGIAPENLTRIFSHGFTTKSDGHGFGLHSAANAAREMGGSLSAASEGVNKGAIFTLDLPLQFVAQETACRL